MPPLRASALHRLVAAGAAGALLVVAASFAASVAMRSRAPRLTLLDEGFTCATPAGACVTNVPLLTVAAHVLLLVAAFLAARSAWRAEGRPLRVAALLVGLAWALVAVVDVANPLRTETAWGVALDLALQALAVGLGALVLLATAASLRAGPAPKVEAPAPR